MNLKRWLADQVDSDKRVIVAIKISLIACQKKRQCIYIRMNKSKRHQLNSLPNLIQKLGEPQWWIRDSMRWRCQHGKDLNRKKKGRLFHILSYIKRLILMDYRKCLLLLNQCLKTKVMLSQQLGAARKFLKIVLSILQRFIRTIVQKIMGIRSGTITLLSHTTWWLARLEIRIILQKPVRWKLHQLLFYNKSWDNVDITNPLHRSQW